MTHEIAYDIPEHKPVYVLPHDDIRSSFASRASAALVPRPGSSFTILARRVEFMIGCRDTIKSGYQLMYSNVPDGEHEHPASYGFRSTIRHPQEPFARDE